MLLINHATLNSTTPMQSIASSDVSYKNALTNKKVKYGFMFKFRGENVVTYYDQEACEKIDKRSPYTSTLEVKHTIRRGPREGQVDTHQLDFINWKVINKSQPADITGEPLTHTLVCVNIDSHVHSPIAAVLERAKARKEEALKKVRDETLRELLSLLEI